MVRVNYTRGFNKWLVGFIFKYELGFDEPLSYHCGVSDSDEVKTWHPKLKLIDDWIYLNSDSEKLGFERQPRHFKNGVRFSGPPDTKSVIYGYNKKPLVDVV